MAPKKLNQLSGMPQITDAMNGWGSQITLLTVSQLVDSQGLITQSTKQVTFTGVIQPLSPKMIALKPEGQRSFQWLQIHCYEGDLELDDNDQIQYNGATYKVMAILPYDLNNFREYHVIKAYQ